MQNKGTSKHEAGGRLSFVFAKRELNAVGMSIRKIDGEYTVVHVSITLALLDPFQPMAHEQDAWGGRLSKGQRREWAAVLLSQISSFDANLVGQLLEDRAAFCTRNAIACRPWGVDDYWSEQHDHAAKLGRQFRDAGTDAGPVTPEFDTVTCDAAMALLTDAVSAQKAGR